MRRITPCTGSLIIACQAFALAMAALIFSISDYTQCGLMDIAWSGGAGAGPWSLDIIPVSIETKTIPSKGYVTALTGGRSNDPVDRPICRRTIYAIFDRCRRSFPAIPTIVLAGRHKRPCSHVRKQRNRFKCTGSAFQ